ncbi:glycosyltransferase [Erythrobacter sp. SDW2]|uniref:glycosyltransferase n=1 Tax=Erythrobacter sp. SDW2 TaxID=2907154 RepID=UPI001F36DD13|nr:glycosyltransferase [Erythrobacter sp. SDW2]UIP07172.1 glycosyltransferase [Erythrobacter sp. SDW2]
MRILHVVADADPAKGGVIEGVLRLGDAYRSCGHEQHLLTLDAPEDRWVADCPSPVFAMGRASDAKRFYPARAIAWLRQHAGDYDGIVVDGLWNAATLAARQVLPGSGVPYAVFPHGMLDPWFRELQPTKEWVKRQLFRINEGPLLRGARAVLFTAESERMLAAQSWPGWTGMREQVVGFGTGEPPPESDAMHAAFGGKVPAVENSPYVLFLSRIHPKKGIGILLEGFAEACGRGEWQLVIAGPGEAGFVASLRDRAARLGIASQVHWPGMLTGAAKWGALYGCEAMALTSYQENFGVVVAEACACRRPVIVSDQVAVHLEISGAGAGLVCETRPPSVAAALSDLCAMPPVQRKAVGTNGRALFESVFAMEKVAQRVLAVFADNPENG